MLYFIETKHGVLVEVVHHKNMVQSILKEMNARGSIPKRAYTVDSKGRKQYL